jgi:hypothetical protein
MADEAAKKAADDKKALEAANEQRAKEAQERAKTRGKPTPTQMENDLAKLGHHPELEPDGSLPDPNAPAAVKKELQAATAAGGYPTRQATARVEK